MNNHDDSSDKFRITVRVGIVAVFFSVFLTLSVFILLIVSSRFYSNAMYLTAHVTNAISETVMREVASNLQPAFAASRLSAELIQRRIVSQNGYEELASYTYNTLRSIPEAQMVYYGDEKGNFVIARRQSDGTIQTEIINRNSKKVERDIWYRDINGEVIRKESLPPSDYDPRKRPWYNDAKDKKQTIWTPIYVFYSGEVRTLGTTSATPVYMNDKLVGVFGVDVKLDSLSALLAKLKTTPNGLTFIVNKEGKIVAHPKVQYALKDISELDAKWAAEAYRYFKENKDNEFQFEENGEKYIATVYDVPGFKYDNWHIFVIVPVQDIIGPVWRANLITLLLCGVIFLLGLALVSILSRHISAPIRALADDLLRVKEFDIDTTQRVRSRVKEVHMMSTAIHAMKVGLQSFERYVPQKLVKKLISSGEAATLGGRKRRVTMFFSDIADFTSISEKVGDEKIMTQMNEYFDSLAKTISHYSGTVDKYIGDSLMAFWGAPVRDPDHVLNACHAAIACQKSVALQNKQWEAVGKVPFPTRIGVHCGDVVIGNLGSSDRINYTAIGDNVNVASRLEQLNKVYGTEIIISEAVYNEVGDKFIVRLLDRVIVKGRSTPHNIYQLIAENTPENQAQYKEFTQNFAAAFAYYQAQEWDKAIAAFSEYAERFDDDKAANLFIKRSQQFKAEPPETNWNGVWIYTSKDK